MAFGINVAPGPWVQTDSTLGPLSSHALLGQLHLEGGTAPLIDGHIFQRPKFPQLPRWCGEMRREGGCQMELWAGFMGSLSTLHHPTPPRRSTEGPNYRSSDWVGGREGRHIG